MLPRDVPFAQRHRILGLRKVAERHFSVHARRPFPGMFRRKAKRS
jgi:hypothetical protein